MQYNGDGTLFLQESYNNLYTDAEDRFSGSRKATISIDSHVSGEEVLSRSAYLTGTITSGEVLVERLKVYTIPQETGGTGGEYKVDVPENGNFSITIPIEHGTNVLLFSTEGRNSGRNYIALPNSHDTELFELEGVFDEAVILVTLTWDKNDTDVDMYVIDPTGDYSAYYHMWTADGGELDIDNTWGYGPEHWTLTYGDTIRWDEPYQIRSHYFSDNDNGGTNFNISVLLYEGTEHEVRSTYSGYHGVSDPTNHHPEGTGSDWVNVATVTPVQHSGSSVSSADVSVAAMPDGSLDIRVPVPVGRAK